MDPDLGDRRRREMGPLQRRLWNDEESDGGGARSRKRGRGDDAAAADLDNLDRVKKAALRLLSVRMRSRRELEIRLRRKGFRAKAVREALDDFERVGLVDDQKFARLFLESRLRLRPRSYNVLMSELRAKGLAEELIKEVVDECRLEVSEEDLARRALSRRMKSVKGASPDEARARAARFLAGKGFAPSLIAEVVNDI
jgi:regulatory protein